jgi:cytochrome c biogenesis protein CcmG/thiol:disulfide interchange protein DsbE
MTDANERDDPRSRRSQGWTLAPVLVFAVMAGLFAFALFFVEPSKLPSTLIGKPVPSVSFPPLDGLAAAGTPVPGFTAADLAKGKVTVVNFWASWCRPCVEEHPLLIELKARTGVDVYGVNYKDDQTNARRFLGLHGNPFTAVGTDAVGRAAIEWGVYAMPETFVVDGRGRIAYKHVGPLSPQSLLDKIIPAVELARGR